MTPQMLYKYKKCHPRESGDLKVVITIFIFLDPRFRGDDVINIILYKTASESTL